MNTLPKIKLLLKNGRLICPGTNLDYNGDLFIEDGYIADLGINLNTKIATNNNKIEIIDCSNLIIAPGLIDLHVHLREPGHEYKETIATGTAAAAAGGFTTVCCMPNTNPTNDCRSITEIIIQYAHHFASCRVYPIGAITKGLQGKYLSQIAELQEAGCVAISDDGRPVTNTQLLRRAMEYASDFNLLVICHSEELLLSSQGVMNESPTATHLGLRGIPAEAETIAVERDLALARLSKSKVHIAHISTAGSVEAIRRAKEAGNQITCETAPHYLTLIDKNIGDYDTNFKINPPLRSEIDREAIRKGLADNIIDAVATDHAPHSVLEKMVEFDKAAFGIIGLETCLGIMLKLVEEGILSLHQALQKLTSGPAKSLGLPIGTLQKGNPADIVVINLKKPWRVDPKYFRSLSRNTPFTDWVLPGRAVLTICNGRITYRL